MTRTSAAVLTILLLTGVAAKAAPMPKDAAPRQVRELADGWKFLRGEAAGADAAAFDDGAWQTVSVPQDWAIAGPFDRENKSGGAGAFLPYGVGWYRRRLDVGAADQGKRVFIEFDGVMAHSKVWLNGHLLGERPNGFVSFGYELTPYVNFGGGNMLVVRTDTSLQPASRWYEGAGIYRKVRLVVDDPVHVARWGTVVTTPKVSAEAATVQLRVRVQNQSTRSAPVALRVKLLGPDGRVAATGRAAEVTIARDDMATYNVTMTVPHPDRWDVAHGALYRAVVDVVSGATVRDVDTQAFGIREFRFDAATGFWLNGKNFKLYGACLHGDVSGFGIAVPAEAYRERLLALRALGVNAVRTAHGPPSPQFLEQADRLGFLVMDEMFDMWSLGKNPYDYHLDFAQWHVQDTRDTAMRDRNHPSIVLWSAGNEIRDTPQVELATRELGGIVDAFHAEDPTRPVTQALFRPNVSHDYEDGLADMLDVVGQNYRTNELIAAHERKPTRKVVGTENAHDLDQWLALRDHAFFSGEFLWSGADYLGESRTWPGVSRSNGLLDRTNAVHVRGLQRASWWLGTPFVAVVRRERPTPKAPTDPGYEKQQMGDAETTFHDWTPQSLAAHDENVEVYSNCKRVDLRLNGASLGEQAIHADDSARLWSVAFAPGELVAVCTDAKGIVDALKTAGKPDHLLVTSLASRVGGSFDDAVQVRAVVVDAAGVPVPRAAEVLRFAVRGPGTVVVVDNGDTESHEPFQSMNRSAYDGQAVAYVRGTGVGLIRVTVSSVGIKTGEVSLHGMKP